MSNLFKVVHTHFTARKALYWKSVMTFCWLWMLDSSFLGSQFDTIDHIILVDWLERWVGISGWFRSYLTGSGHIYVADVSQWAWVVQYRPQHLLTMVSLRGQFCAPSFFPYICFTLVTSSAIITFRFTAMRITQLCFPIRPSDQASVAALHKCLSDIKCWMSDYFLLLNDKNLVLLHLAPTLLKLRL